LYKLADFPKLTILTYDPILPTTQALTEEEEEEEINCIYIVVSRLTTIMLMSRHTKKW
jgi:hypothetical protein